MVERNMPIGREDRHRLASFLWRGSLNCGIVTLLKLLIVCEKLIGCKMNADSDSVISIISNSFLQRMAILTSKRTTLYASFGTKKSFWMVSIRDSHMAAVRLVLCVPCRYETTSTETLAGPVGR